MRGNFTKARVAILLCTYNGQRFLEEQLDSFEAQTHENWVVCASDDGSQDLTLSILEEYQKKWPANRLVIRSGPRKGYAKNFLSLVCRDEIKAEYYAYSDQDDIWEKEKLTRALHWLETLPKDCPALYCSRTCLVDTDNKEIGYSPLFKKTPSFANALTQNIGGGNTMVFNASARALLQDTAEYAPLFFHDWWTYLVVSGCGGLVFYDAYPSLRYRQHQNNLVGMNSNWRARFQRIGLLWQGQFKEWNDINTTGLMKMYEKLSLENRNVLDHFCAARQESLIPRLKKVRQSGVYRQNLLGNLGLVAAAIFNKL